MPRRRIAGIEGSGHAVGLLALLGLAAYGALVASQSIEVVHLYPTAAQRTFGLVGWLLWIGSYVWSIVSVLRGRRHTRATQAVAVGGLVWSMVLMVVMGAEFAGPPALSFATMLLCLSGRVRGIGTVLSLLAYFGQIGRAHV